MFVLTAKPCGAFELCPTPSVLHGADVRKCTAMGILEIGRNSIWGRRGGGCSRNVNKDRVKAEASSFIPSFFSGC